jgi:molecular chaperone GrpE
MMMEKSSKSSKEAEKNPESMNSEDQSVETEDIENEIDSIENELDTIRQENQEIKEKYLLLAADFENYRKRQDRIMCELMAQERDNISSKLLEIADDVSRALEAVKQNVDPATIVEGVQMISDRISELLKLEGIEPMDPVGNDFDPLTQDAVAVQPVDDPVEDGKVIGVIQMGYVRGGRLVRPPKVIVGKYDKD